jgi:hypothetical protein
VPEGAESGDADVTFPNHRSSARCAAAAPCGPDVAPTAPLELTSRYSHVYGAYPFTNNPADGDQQHYFDDVRVVFPRTLPASRPCARGQLRGSAAAPAASAARAAPRGRLEALGLEGTHFHDLRHTGNQFSAAAGANLHEMMTRMGQGSPHAALIYLHASDERQRSIADRMGKNAKTALRKPAAKPSGTQRARGRGHSEKAEYAGQDSNPRPAA